MRRRWGLITVGSGLALLVAGCGPQGSQVVPTAAALPTVTPTPSPTEPPFLTATPTEMPPPADMPDGDQPTASAGDNSPLFASPTPEGGAVSEGETGPATTEPVETGPCSSMAFNASLNATDLTALDADLQAFVTSLFDAPAPLGDWVLDTTLDPFTTAGIQGVLPQASLRFRRETTGDGTALPQEAFLLVARLGGPLRTYFNRCVADESYFRQSDVSSAAVVTITPLAIGDRGALAVIVEAADPEAGDSGLGDLTTEVHAVLTGDTLYQLVNIPALAAAVGQSPLTREDAEGLLQALLSVEG